MIDKIALKESIDRICEETGLQLYDWHVKGQNKSHKLAVYINKSGGVTLDDCEEYSRLLGDELDMHDVITTRYFLEVSSPGLERPLLRPEHFQSAVNEKVKIVYFDDDLQSQTVIGIVTHVKDELISVKDDKDDIHQINLSSIKKAKTIFNWPDKTKTGTQSK